MWRLGTLPCSSFEGFPKLDQGCVCGKISLLLTGWLPSVTKKIMTISFQIRFHLSVFVITPFLKSLYHQLLAALIIDRFSRLDVICPSELAEYGVTFLFGHP